MKNNYQAPVLEDEKLEAVDVITASGELVMPMPGDDPNRPWD